MSEQMISKAAEMIKENTVYGGARGFGVCTLSLIDAEGYPTASAITPSKAEGIQWLTFGTMLDQARAERIKGCNRASISFLSDEYCINLVGEMEILTSAEIKQEMWYDGLGQHFSGPDDPNYCVLKFRTKRYKLFLDFMETEGVL